MNSEELINLSTIIEEKYNKHQAMLNLKEKILQKLFFSYNGGLFKASPELICLLSCFGDNELVLKDEYDVPVAVNRNDILEIAKRHYQSLMNSWLVEYESIKFSKKQDLKNG